ncbi:MAG: hypothetical protein ACK2UL_04305 [Anaerolineae bacterium]|jgi:hypothetical protein
MVRALVSIGKFGMGLLVGGSLGYFVAVLLAPQEGALSRGALGDESDALRRGPRETFDGLQARILFAIEEGRRAAEETRAELERGLLMPVGDAGSGTDSDAGAGGGAGAAGSRSNAGSGSAAVSGSASGSAKVAGRI